MTVEFMVEWNHTFESDIEYEIVESQADCDNPCIGYDIYRVETDDFRKIRISNDVTGGEYEADSVVEFKGGYYVNCWNPIAE